jgi:predicted RNA binding protein YcfA (HicA-like mRNA interferase family)
MEVSSFPSLKAPQLLAVLRREPLRYQVVRRRGSHRFMRSARGYPPILFAYHDRATVSPESVRKMLVRDVGLSVGEARRLL